MSRVRRGGPAAVVALLLAVCAPLSAQGASSYIPTGHWAHRALARLDGLGLLTGYDPVSRAVPVKEVQRHFETASERAGPDLAVLVDGYRVRFNEETGGGIPANLMGGPGTEADPSDMALVFGRVTAAYEGHAGGVRPGVGGFEETDWTGPIAVPTTSEPFLSAGGGVAVGRVASQAAARVSGSGFEVDEVYGVLATGPVGLWFGRRPWGYSVGMGGGLVLDSLRLDGGGLVLRPVAVPWIGRLGFETSLSRAADNGFIGWPWLWTMRLSAQPHPRLGIGFTRAAMFGGERNLPVTADRIWKVVIGKHVAEGGSGFENQLGSIDVRYRLPAPVPAVLRLEWGFEDSAGAISEQPGIVAAIDVVAVPGLPQAAVGLEYTRFAGLSLGHWIWYRHWWFHEGWTDEGRHMGHPLGGHGSEWRLYGGADLARSTLRLSSQLFARDRGEYNVYAPDREGGSFGAVVEVDWRVFRNVELLGGVAWEEGSDWRDRSGRIGVRWVGGVGQP